MLHKCLLAGFLTLTAALAQADVLLIDSVERDAQTATSRPERGMSMQAVESRFGVPEQRHGAVGEPPIARWEYPDFIVYFEENLVIHAVVRH